jgi:excisionase family DNA binding protein
MQNKKKVTTLPQRWFTIDEAASHMRFSPQCVRNFIHGGGLRASRIGNTYRLDRQIIDQFLLDRDELVGPYRRNTKPWVAERHAANRRKVA